MQSRMPRGELLSLARLEEFAEELAREHVAITARVPAQPLLPLVDRSSHTLDDAYNQISEVARQRLPLMPGDEWLLDNYHVVRDTVREVQVDLPHGYYLQLPRLGAGLWRGYARVYALACELLVHTDGTVDILNVEALCRGYQVVIPLNMGELWAAPAMLRLALIERLANLATELVETRRQFNAADELADRIVASADALVGQPGAVVQVPAELRRLVQEARHGIRNTGYGRRGAPKDGPGDGGAVESQVQEGSEAGGRLSPTFVARLVQRLREAGPEVAPILPWLEEAFTEAGVAPPDAMRAEFGRQTALQAAISNAITSMRTISVIDWAGFVERSSVVESILRTDPAAVYPQMDFDTRDRYRHIVERLARHSRLTEPEVASLTVQLAAHERGSKRHVGYFLIDDGAARVRHEVHYRAGWGERIGWFVRAHPTAVYLGSIAAVTLGVLASAVAFITEDEPVASPWWTVAILLLALLPVSEFAVGLVNQIVSLLMPPRVLPKLDYSGGIPAEQRTFVATPTMFRSRADVTEVLRHVELLHLANPDPQLFYVVLSDFADAPAEHMEGDDELLALAAREVEELNGRYGGQFFLFHRKRQWNPAESVWMGWERKRGKLADFNALLRGAVAEPFLTSVGAMSVLSGTRFVITLDADTDLPKDAARRLIGTLAHPLNRPELDARTGLVVRGYGILQPRVTTKWESSRRTLFSRIYAGQTGIDPYTSAVSNLYQDLFGEGIFIGKGIYDVDAFRAATDDRFPSNAILSHDLLEGSFARAGFVSDVELYEDFPAQENVYEAREHRWIRGDWQILGWLMPQIRTRTGRQRNPLPLSSRWRIFDNLRRSLVAPAVVALLAVAWTRLPGYGLFWTAGVLLTLALPIYAHLITSLGHKAPGTTWGRHLAAVTSTAGTNLAHFILAVAFMAHRAWYISDAVIRTLVRVYFTHRNLLKWVTAAEAARRLGNTRRDYLRHMWDSIALALLIGLATLLLKPTALLLAAPFLLLWIAAPLIAYRLSQPLTRRVYQASESELRYLRRAARKSWRYFEDFCNAENHWLAPDNFQEDPPVGLARRTSPTNLSLLLLSSLSAYDMGFLTISALTARLAATLGSMESLERYRGHFYNWYDTSNAKPLLPLYISTVDSGNLVGHLLALKQGCMELPYAPLYTGAAFQGLRDLLGIVDEQIQRIEAMPGHPDLTNMTEAYSAVELLLAAPTSLPDWATLAQTLVPAANRMAAAATDLSASTPVAAALDTGLGKRKPDGRKSAETGLLRAEQELAYWAACFVQATVRQRDEIAALFPWAVLLPAPASLAANEHWRTLLAPILGQNSLVGNLGWCARAVPELRRLQGTLRGAADEQDAMAWLEQFRAAVGESWRANESLIHQLRGVAARTGALAAAMRFDFLYDETRELFAIGYNVGELRRDNSYYDLLASESRLASYVAIARGEVPQKHWFHLGRPITGNGSALTLFSWTGTMFEYLMPNLVLDVFDNSLLDQAGRGAVRVQQDYARRHDVPWGISEAAYNVLGPDGSYQYRAFGVPELGLKRGLSDDLVVAPYATLLALPIDPAGALQNLRRLAALGLEGRYGFYEAMDFTQARRNAQGGGSLIATFMVHHIGMGLLAINNYLNDKLLLRRFAAEPSVEAMQLLLQERIPLEAPRTVVDSGERSAGRGQTVDVPMMVRRYSTGQTSVPHAQLISNGRYSVMITNAGSGYSRLDKLAVTRWREEQVRDSWGTFIYIKDVRGGQAWSAASAPLPTTPTHYSATFALDRADFRRQDGTIETRMEVVVSPEDDAEVRRITLTNRGRRFYELELTSYAEVVIAPPGGDDAHPAFSKLFVETEYDAALGALIARRRPRSADDAPVWLVHVLAVEREPGAPEFPGGTGADEYETDRAAFLGRGGTLAAPAALNGPLQGTTGAVLDPIVSLRKRVRLESNGRLRLAFTTAVAYSAEQAHALADKYRDYSWADRAHELAATQARLELRQLGIAPEEAVQYGRLFSRMIYPRRATRAAADLMARNSRGQQALWAYGISGDLPILLVRIGDQREMGLMQQALRAHEFWLSNGFQADLVVLDLHPGGYTQPVSDEIGRLVASSHARSMINKPGGVFIRRADTMPETDLILLSTAARVILSGARGSLVAQLDRDELPPPAATMLTFPAQPAPTPQAAPLPAIDLRFANDLGGFDSAANEYVITLGKGVWTPLPWSNVIANPRFGCMLTESGLGSSWSENSRENRLTPWSNDPITDPPAEVIYIRDEESGEFWTPTPLPVREDTPYRTRHGQGYSIYEHESHGIASSLLVFVPPQDPVKLCVLTLRNNSDRPRRLSTTYYAEWVLGVMREAVARFVITEAGSIKGVITARNPYSMDFAARVAFAAISADNYTLTADRREFLGPGGSPGNPAALRQALSGRSGAGFDPCAALQCLVQLEPGQEQQVVFALGQGEHATAAAELASKYRDLAQVQAAYQATRAAWDQLLGAVEVQTPDEALNLLLNRWLLYQALSCRIWGRSAFYQGGGAYGFRDQLQDVMATIYAAGPQGAPLLREQLLLNAAHQFKEGDVQHWWHPPVGRGVRTRFSDDLIWLPFVTAYYVQATGDTQILDEQRPFLEAPLLEPGQEDMYLTPTVAEESGTLYEHCLRAIARGNTQGAHGLPLMGAGDWNDGMNRVGIEGHGESVWLGWFLYATLSGFVPLCEARGDSATAAEFRATMARLKDALDQSAWDGAWYRRAYYDDGTPLGSAESDECKIDAIAQTWAVISGAGDAEKAARAMRAVEEWLVRPEEQMILLFTPPFDKTPHNPGYIKGYLPGVRENGGQYTHGVIWTGVARALMGDGDGAFRVFDMLNPINHTRGPAEVARYMVEPYVVAADVYSHPQHLGRGGWTWYTGSASWLYRLGVEYILGLRRHGDYLTIEPCVPASWPGYSIVYRYGAAKYRITVELQSSDTPMLVEVDGAAVEGGKIALVDDGQEHDVRITAPRKEAQSPRAYAAPLAPR